MNRSVLLIQFQLLFSKLVYKNFFTPKQLDNKVLGQLPPKKIAPDPKTNPNPNPNPNVEALFLGGNCLVASQP